MIIWSQLLKESEYRSREDLFAPMGIAQTGAEEIRKANTMTGNS
jgi:hypothetical protein